MASSPTALFLAQEDAASLTEIEIDTNVAVPAVLNNNTPIQPTALTIAGDLLVIADALGHRLLLYRIVK
jgi:hypothetical protein